MMPLLAQTETVGGTSALTSIAAILSATWLIVALLKRFIPTIKGRGTLAVALGVSVGLVLIAIYVTRTLEAEPLDAVIAVLSSVAGAAGIKASGETIKKTPTKTSGGLQR